MQVAALLIAASVSSAEPIQLFVSPQGNDAWSGALAAPNASGTDGPLATITAARDKVRASKQEGRGGVTVILRGGVYRLDSPLSIRFWADSGDGPDHNVVYRGAPGETAVISGGQPISNWTRQGDLWMADLPAVRDGDWKFSSLWVNGERRQRARTPNAAHPWGDNPEDSDTFNMESPVEETNASGEKSRSASKFKYREGDLQAWPDLDQAIFVIYHSWETSLMRVKDLDTTNRIVEFTGGARWAFGQWQPDQRYFVENVRAALDQPGEWYLDEKAGQLYYWPLNGESPETTEVVAPVLQQLLRLDGDSSGSQWTEYLRFENLIFEHTDFPIAPEGHSDAQAAFTVNAAIETTGARDVVFERCTIRHTGNHGIWFRTGSRSITMRQCELYDLGAGGVRIGEGSTPEDIANITERITIDNCLIHEGGRVFRGAVGVWTGRSSYNQITHNEIRNFRYTGISVGWSWGYDPSSAHHNRIENNHIHHIGLGQLNDMGGIYTLGISPGTALRGNVIHDVWSHPRLYGGWGLYTDEGSSNILIENNLAYDVRTGSFHQHYGRDNWIINNILAFSAEPQIVRSREEEHNSFMFERNIVIFDSGELLGSTWKNNNWISDYNVFWDMRGKPLNLPATSLGDWHQSGHDTHSLIADPKFVDPAKRDFRLGPDSPALTLGFQPFDFTKAGLYGDPDWVARAER